MKGILYKLKEGIWYVYELALKKHHPGGVSEYIKNYYPLHPHDAQQYQETYDFYGATGFKPTQVDFELVDGYAQLITMLSEEETEEYPELEGTMNLCNDIISERKYTKEDLIDLVETLTSTPSNISREAATHIVDHFIKSKQ